VPRPGSLSTVTKPWCCCITRRTTARPSPAPFALVVKSVTVGQPISGAQECVKTGFAYNGTRLALVASGQSCAPVGGSTRELECVPPATCLTSQLCGTRTLTSLNGAALNAPCDNVRRCQLGLSCSEANVCVVERLVPLGGTCDFSNRACDYGEAFCDFSAGGNTGICVALRGPNATCEGVYQCRSELTCKGPPGTTVCAPPSAVGGPCWYGQSSDACVIGTCCTATSTVMTGVCANRKGQGASCVEGSECQGACVNSMCTRPSCVDPTP